MEAERHDDIWRMPVVLSRIIPDKNERRFYAIDITSDLFGQVILIRNWGRIGTGGQMRSDHYSDFAAAKAAFLKLERSKRMRGYNARAQAGEIDHTSKSPRSTKVPSNKLGSTLYCADFPSGFF